MPTPEKTQFVEELEKKFEESKGIYFTDFLGLTVEQMNDLRGRFFNASVEYKVVKNRLTRISASQAGYEDMGDLLSGPTAIAFTSGDPVAPAKILTDFAEENGSLALKGCIFEGERLSKERIEAIAKLPSRNELIQKFLGSVQSPMRNMVNILSSPMQNLVTALGQIREQKSE